MTSQRLYPLGLSFTKPFDNLVKMVGTINCVDTCLFLSLSDLTISFSTKNFSPHVSQFYLCLSRVTGISAHLVQDKFKCQTEEFTRKVWSLCLARAIACVNNPYVHTNFFWTCLGQLTKGLWQEDLSSHLFLCVHVLGGQP